jgi:DNA mismatch repair ATPase MutS
LALSSLRIRTEHLRALEFLPPPVDPDEMLMDAQTYKDLEIFEGEGGKTSVFDLCNLTRTDGGAKALRQRMKKPWSRPEKILAVQESLAFLMAHRTPFDRLPSNSTTRVLEKYLHGSLPLLNDRNLPEFWIGSFELRFGGDFRPYMRIVRGVNATSALVRSLRRIVASPELQHPTPDVARILDEVRVLVARPAFSAVGPQERWDLPWWTVMRLDLLFRRRERAAIEQLLELVFELDSLIAMADCVSRNDFVMPEIMEGPLAISGEGLYHPFIANAVPNPVRLDQEHRMLFLTGPNMAGKTTYLRACGIALYLAHLGMGVPATSFRFSPCQRLFSSVTVHDDVRSGISFFRAEALRVKAIAQAVTDGYRVVALMDEPFKGTNVKDALDASRAILERLAAKVGSLFVVSSHLIELGEQMVATGQVECQHFEAREHEGRLRFEYRLQPGVSTQRLGMRVLREEGIFALLDGSVPAVVGEAPRTA